MHKKNRSPDNSKNSISWYDPAWLAMVFKERYGPAEKKSSVVKVMVPVSLMIKTLKRIFKK